MSDLFQPPRYYRDVTFHKHTDRTVGFLELFYDLVYVATLIQIGNFLSDNPNLLGFGQFLVLLFVVWWAWTGETAFQNRYYIDDITHRLLVLLQMFGVAAMGLSVSEAFGSLSAQFALSFVLVRSLLAVMWVRAYRAHQPSRSLAVGYLIGFVGGIAIWLGSIALPEDVRWVAWLAAIVFEIVFFSRPTMIRATVSWAPDDHHFVERFGIFTIIVLGEAFVKVLDDAQGTSLGTDQMLSGMALLTLLFGLWWLHFSDTADELYDLNSNIKPLAWSYGHLFLAASLVMYGVAAKKLFAESISYPGESVTESYRLLLTAAIVGFLIAQALINSGFDDSVTDHNQARRVVIYLGAAVVVGGLGLLASGLTGTQLTAAVAVVVIALVVDAIAQTKRADAVAAAGSASG
ncbi:MAG: low temperature requirement protein A [Actinomycetota bacterium]